MFSLVPISLTNWLWLRWTINSVSKVKELSVLTHPASLSKSSSSAAPPKHSFPRHSCTTLLRPKLWSLGNTWDWGPSLGWIHCSSAFWIGLLKRQGSQLFSKLLLDHFLKASGKMLRSMWPAYPKLRDKDGPTFGIVAYRNLCILSSQIHSSIKLE